MSLILRFGHVTPLKKITYYNVIIIYYDKVDQCNVYLLAGV